MNKPKTYKVQYICINCLTKMTVEVDFGQPMPLFSENKNTIENGYTFPSPECKYCGCKYWSRGKLIR